MKSNTIEMQHKDLSVTIRRSVGKTWYMILTNEKTNKAWTSGVYSKADAVRDGVDFIMGHKPLPTSMLGEIPISKELYTETLEQKRRRCNYCLNLYGSPDIFAEHWKVCPGRHLAGILEPR